jgi:hypothetical protein
MVTQSGVFSGFERVLYISRPTPERHAKRYTMNLHCEQEIAATIRPEDIASRFHRSVHLHFQGCCMDVEVDDMAFESSSQSSAIPWDSVIGGSDSPASVNFSPCQTEGKKTC